MLLSDIVSGMPGVISVDGDGEFTSIVCDSRACVAGSLFVALAGSKADGHNFISDAIRSGAAAVIHSSDTELSVPSARVVDTQDSLWRMSKKLYGDPSAELTMVGITGTNGKTTTAWIAAQALNALGIDTAYIGTLGVIHRDLNESVEFTTPFPPDLFSMLRRLRDRGATTIVMEVSSHALEQRRVDGVEFDVAVFTNLSQDHLDFHPDMNAYFAAKQRLFGELESTKRLVGVANCDDPWGQKLVEKGIIDVSFGEHCGDIRVVESGVSVDNISLIVSIGDEPVRMSAKVGGRFNVMNLVAAVSCLVALGHPPQSIAKAMRGVHSAPGRFEAVPTGSSFGVIVDYAHTPDALEKLLAAVRELKPRRILTVFGCGGDRDTGKRPKMAFAATKWSDLTFVTSDNPRSEDPNVIIAGILEGTVDGAHIRVEPDRRAAIHQAIAEADEDDIVVIAGKGHEDYQILASGKIHFDDREVALEAVKEKVACA